MKLEAGLPVPAVQTPSQRGERVMTYDNILVETRGGVGIITLNRPKSPLIILKTVNYPYSPIISLNHTYLPLISLNHA